MSYEKGKKRRYKQHGLSSTYEWKMWKKAKHRARIRGVDFNLEVTDIHIPETCPLLGIAITITHGNGTGGKRNNSPSLDCFDPALGYVKENVWVISNRANTIKRELSLEQWKMFVAKLEENSDSTRRNK